ncbi:MAG: hypothetical protein JRJ21_10520, partial [Deltaproteobacteria bacterium]|nr:hypothetical protein [Deltaproteobacteria bacterium]
NITQISAQGNPFECQYVWHMGSGKRIPGKQQGDDGEGRSDDPAGGFQKQNDKDAADKQIAGSGGSRSHGNALIVQHDVEGGQSADSGKSIIDQGNPISN